MITGIAGTTKQLLDLGFFAPLVIQDASNTSSLAVAADIAMILVALALLVMIGIGVVMLTQLRQGQQKLMDFFEKMKSDMAPSLRNVEAISNNLASASDLIKRRMTEIDATLDDANEKVRDVVAMAHSRVRDVDAFLAVAQEEVEDVFVKTASTVRGLNSGVRGIFEGAGSGKGGADMDGMDDMDELFEADTRDAAARGVADRLQEFDESESLFDTDSVYGAERDTDVSHGYYLDSSSDLRRRTSEPGRRPYNDFPADNDAPTPGPVIRKRGSRPRRTR